VDQEPELPLLGEPPSVELANTLYGEDPVDFLANPAVARLWVARVLPDADLAAAPPAWLRELGALRDATRRLLLAAADGRPGAARDADLVNRWSLAAPRTWSVAPGDGGPRGAVRRSGPAHRVALAVLAEDCARVLSDADRHPLRQCAAGDCTMLFVRRHHRRRWCHDSCGHRTRQAAYHRRRARHQGAVAP
jgi:predicted RNA-binding Zn ribbon-like protein